MLPGPGKILVFFGGVDDFSPGLEGRVGDQFGHPQGVQVKSSKFLIIISPPSDGPVSVSRYLKAVWPEIVGATKWP